MSFEIAIHQAQTMILRELLFRPQASYADLQKRTKLTSDHFNFHINRLVQLGLVERIEKGVYGLSILGKEYANKLDTDNNTIERQPKVAVLLAITREVDGALQYVIQRRVKNPNFGFYGFPTGKVRWGETIIQTAQRECLEETGLQAEFTIAGVYHEHVRTDETNKLFEDKIFFICKAENIQGELQERFEGGENQWLTLKEFQGKDKKFSSVHQELKIIETNTWMVEDTVVYQKEMF